jgi:hypothetical protein
MEQSFSAHVFDHYNRPRCQNAEDESIPASGDDEKMEMASAISLF